MELLIKDVQVIDHAQDFIGDVYIKFGKIMEMGRELNKNCEVIEGRGLKLLPAFVDLHSHFREPGYTYKEDIYTGSLAALKGGFTAVNLMANTNPICSNNEVLKLVMDKSKEYNLVDIHQCVSITENLQGSEISHLDKISKDFHVKFISDDGKGVADTKVMIDAMNKAKEKNITIISHAESPELSEIDMRLAENTMTWRDIMLSKFTGANLHLAHVSTKEAMKYIIDAKDEGMNITCEVTPHHIAFTEDYSYRVNPPLRKEEDRNFLIKAIKLGYVDAIATDHAPHSEEDKAKGAPGMIGLESAFMVCYTELVKKGHIDIKALSKIMSYNPSKIMGLNKGQISIGYDGDFVLVDTESKYKFDIDNIKSKSHNSPFIGYEGYGKIMATIKAGRILYRGDGV